MKDKELKSYGIDSKEDYVAYLQGKEGKKSNYKDPDGTYDKKEGDNFYPNLVKFLNKSEKFLEDKADEREFKRFEYKMAEEESGDCGYKVPPGIAVFKNKETENNDVFYLRSDQFGFSAPTDENDRQTWEEKYPYGKYISLCRKLGISFEEYAETVAETIYYTRTIGGSLIWPIQKCKTKWMNLYNMQRGADSYIEDRVDLTLFEIWQVFEKINNNKDYKPILLPPERREHETYYPDFEEWLGHFGSFENYIEFFMLNDFVTMEGDKYYPIDLFTRKKMDESSIQEYKGKDSNKFKYIQEKANKEELETFFLELKERTIKRSKKMEEIIYGSKESRTAWPFEPDTLTKFDTGGK